MDSTPSDTAQARAASTAGPAVRHLRQVLLWPLRLMPLRGPDGARLHRTPWQVLRDLGEASPWRELIDEYAGDNARFHERHYNEFVTFLPYVQRFLYGEGRKARNDGDRDADAPMRADARPRDNHWRVSAGSITASISSVAAMLIALPLA